MTNLKLASRTLARTPFVTGIAVVSLALGIGANAAIFSIFDQILMARLPVRAPEELVSLKAPGPNPGSQSCNDAGGCDEVCASAELRQKLFRTDFVRHFLAQIHAVQDFQFGIDNGIPPVATG